METTLTIRLSIEQRRALKRRATAEKRTESALVREMIQRELQRGFDLRCLTSRRGRFQLVELTGRRVGPSLRAVGSAPEAGPEADFLVAP
jgi:hypothetical protein